MRILLGITTGIAVIFVVAAWANISPATKQHGAASIDPASLTATKTNLPTEHYDAF